MFHTEHSRIRAQQRGVTPAQIDAIKRHFDMKVHRGGGVVAIWISKKKLKRFGSRTPEGVPTDQLHSLIVLQSYDQVWVTVIRNRKSKVYRRDARKRPCTLH